MYTDTRTATGLASGRGIVLFERQEQAQHAMDTMNGKDVTFMGQTSMLTVSPYVGIQGIQCSCMQAGYSTFEQLPV